MIYAALIVSLLYGLCLLIPQDPFTYRAFRSQMVAVGLIDVPSPPSVFPPRSADESRNDPEINAALPTGGVFDQLRKAVNSKASASGTSGYLIVFVGDCASCLAFDVQACKRDAAQHHLTMVLLTTGTPSEAQKFQKRTFQDGIVFSDPKYQIIQVLNARWQPRCYLFTNDFRLRWLQKNNQPYYNPFANADFLDALKQVAL